MGDPGLGLSTKQHPRPWGVRVGARPDCRVQGGAQVGAAGARVVTGDFVGGSPPAGVRVTGGPCVLEGCCTL